MENTTTKHISALDIAQPASSDAISEADNHLRFIKDCIKQTFSGVNSEGSSATVTATSTELNKLDGYTGTTGDLNVLSGAVTSGVVPADMAKLANITVSAAEINRVTGLTADIATTFATLAPLNAPAFTGDATAVTQATSDDSTKIATTAYVTAKQGSVVVYDAGTGTLNIVAS